MTRQMHTLKAQAAVTDGQFRTHLKTAGAAPGKACAVRLDGSAAR